MSDSNKPQPKSQPSKVLVKESAGYVRPPRPAPKPPTPPKDGK